MMLADVVAVAGVLVPCMPDWAHEQCAYVRVFEAAVAERIFAEEYPQLRNLATQVREAGALGTRIAILFSAPEGTPIKLFSYAGGIRDAITVCVYNGYVLAAVFDPIGD